MLSYFEERRRIGRVLYKVRTWRLFGVLVLRRYDYLTVPGDLATPEERV